MNTKYIAYNLQEAQEEIELMLARIKTGKEYAHEDFYQSMQHLIHHVNIAWNARNVSEDEAEDLELSEWSHFPDDIKLI